ncbi:MAG TPA: hypothetical protein VFK94_02745 [Patescibacteria group bacterium]|nr:hypothetical protein [Patescibacteria group bacterium]
MARLSKADEEALESFGFEFAEPPEKEDSRRSRYDEMWAAAKTLCEKNPGKSLKVRSYNNASTAYNDAKAINNAEHRMFSDGEPADWTAVAVKNTEVLNDKDEPTYDLYLKRN